MDRYYAYRGKLMDLKRDLDPELLPDFVDVLGELFHSVSSKPINEAVEGARLLLTTFDGEVARLKLSTAEDLAKLRKQIAWFVDKVENQWVQELTLRDRICELYEAVYAKLRGEPIGLLGSVRELSVYPKSLYDALDCCRNDESFLALSEHERLKLERLIDSVEVELLMVTL